MRVGRCAGYETVHGAMNCFIQNIERKQAGRSLYRPASSVGPACIADAEIRETTFQTSAFLVCTADSANAQQVYNWRLQARPCTDTRFSYTNPTPSRPARGPLVSAARQHDAVLRSPARDRRAGQCVARLRTYRRLLKSVGLPARHTLVDRERRTAGAVKPPVWAAPRIIAGPATSLA